MKTVLASCMNPDTEKPILWPSRVSAFIPVNIPITAALLMSAPTPLNIVFWQWVNQTYNAGLNYGNRNASSTQTNSDLAIAYCIACGVSISIAISMHRVANRVLAGKTGFAVAIASNVINYTACMTSTNANTFFIRRSELTNGIMVKHEQTGQEFGNSQIAAKEAITNTMYSRASYCVPIFFFPAIWNMSLQRLRMMPKLNTPLGTFV